MGIKRAVVFLIILIIILVAVLTGTRKKNKVVNVRLEDEILCNTFSVTTTAEDFINVTLPPNSCITKIRATFRVDGVAPDPNWVHLVVFSTEGGVGQRIFETDFDRAPDRVIGAYETDFIHPLCLGPEGGFVSAATELALPADLTISVVYCPGEEAE